jgi:hypothetical protein
LSVSSFACALYTTDKLLMRQQPALSLALRLCCSAALGMSYSFASFATGGLETMFAANMLLIALERASVGSTLLAGCAALAAALAHPDHLLFYGAIGLALLLGRASLAQLLRFAAPFVCVFVPYFAWRVHYYGDWFPNTFYAKSASDAYFAQGFVYLASSLLFGGLLWIGPLAAYGAWQLRSQLLGRFVLVGVLPYLAYVAKIGGDYMYGRLLISVLPITYLCACLGGHALVQREPRSWAAIVSAFLLTVIPLSPAPPRRLQWNMSDERTFTPLASFSPIVVASPMYWRAQLFREVFSGPKAPKPVLAEVEIGMLGYYSGLTIIDFHGLTDRHIAHRPLAQRGRPGHEKEPELEYLQQRGVTLSRIDMYPQAPELRRIVLPTLGDYYVLRWDAAVMKALRRVRGLQQPDFAAYAQQYPDHNEL